MIDRVGKYIKRREARAACAVRRIVSLILFALLTPTMVQGETSSINIDTVRDLLSQCDVLGGDTVINGRINTLKTILGMSGVYDTLTPYKLQKLYELIGDENGASTSLYKLYTELYKQADPNRTKNQGYPGAFPGEITAHGRLNTLMEIILQSAVMVRLGNSTDTPLQNGKTLWSRLRWLAEQPPVAEELTTVIDHMMMLQACLNGTVGLIDSGTMETLLGKTTAPSSVGTLVQLDNALKALQDAVVKSSTEEAEFSTDWSNLVTTLQGVIQNTYKEIAKKVGGLTLALPSFVGDYTEPARFGDTLATVRSLLKKLNPDDAGTDVPFFNLTSLVRTLTYNWPLLLDYIENVDDNDFGTVSKSVYTGKYVHPGLTLMNCLHEVTKFFNLDSVLKKIGRPSADLLDSETLWGQLQTQKAEAPENDAAFIPAENALKLVFRLLENIPALGELQAYSKTLTTALSEVIEEGGDARTKALALRTTFHAYCEAFLPSTITPPNYSDDTVFPYETLFALLVNGSPTEAMYPQIRTALYSTPLVYDIEGTSRPITKNSWIEQLAALNGGGVQTDFWGTLRTPTACSIAKALEQIIAKAGDLMHLTVSGEGVDGKILLAKACQLNIQKAVERTDQDTVDVAAFYERMTRPFWELVEDALGQPADTETDTSNSGLYAATENALSEQPVLREIFRTKMEQLQSALNFCRQQHYPLNFFSIYTNLMRAQTALANGYVGHETDHYLDSTAFGRLNGALFECGAQLIIRLLGKVTDPGKADYGTLRSKLRWIELENQASHDSSVSEKLLRIREKVNSLQGQIQYFYARCLARETSPEVPQASKFEALVATLHTDHSTQWNGWTHAQFTSQSDAFLDECMALLETTDDPVVPENPETGETEASMKVGN